MGHVEMREGVALPGSQHGSRVKRVTCSFDPILLILPDPRLLSPLDVVLRTRPQSLT